MYSSSSFVFSRLLNTSRQKVSNRYFSVSTLPHFQNATATPLTLHTLDGRYATALFNAALKSNQLPTIASDLEKLSKSLDTNPNLNTVLGSPMVNQNEKIKHLTPFLTSCHPISKRFFNVVADNNRLNLLPNMIASFASLMQAHRGEVNVVITSVKPLDKTMMDRIQQALKKGNFLTKQQTMVISNKLNPAILGGMIVEIGDHTLDFSSVTKMAKLSKALFTPV